jgi:hypothetical protein
MSIDKLIRDMVRDEVARAMAPVTAAIEELQAQGAIIARLGEALGAPVKRGPGRPPKVAAAPKVAPAPRVTVAARSKSTKGSKDRPEPPAGEVRLCALEGCKRPTRSKGYCGAHYQKYRLLARTNRLPPDWVENAPPGSVKNVVLPRGRAGAKALAELKKRKKSNGEEEKNEN